jgi:hypothetical protein
MKRTTKPPKRWVPPTDEVLRRIFPKWGDRAVKVGYSESSVENQPFGHLKYFSNIRILLLTTTLESDIVEI